MTSALKLGDSYVTHPAAVGRDFLYAANIREQVAEMTEKKELPRVLCVKEDMSVKNRTVDVALPLFHTKSNALKWVWMELKHGYTSAELWTLAAKFFEAMGNDLPSGECAVFVALREFQSQEPRRRKSETKSAYDARDEVKKLISSKPNQYAIVEVETLEDDCMILPLKDIFQYTGLGSVVIKTGHVGTPAKSARTGQPAP